MCETKMGEAGEAEERPVFRDIRRYYCEYCGICRSKKTLITAHINTHHKEEVEKARINTDFKVEDVKSNTCKECGASFKKPAYLIQHMQSHSLERPYVCAIGDCQASYRRKDHLTRHSLQHQGKTFKCPVENCNRDFAFQGNMTRHVKEFHNENSASTTAENSKQYVCPEVGCGKVFKFASKLKKHEDSHVKLESVEVICLYPDCMKHFTNEQCLQEHIKLCHQYVTCETCGKNQLKKNIKRHLRMHESSTSSGTFKCEYKDCGSQFSSKSNLQKHEKAVHFEEKPFVCGLPGCGMRFSYKHVRDKHEKIGSHVYSLGDFEETDGQFRSRPRGGRKRTCPTVEMLVRKRVTPPSQLHHWLLTQEDDQMH
ncbi:transcription factor IIIA-like isoform X1 [Neltuma alba]|uniref:transcription factor IIIA-like isoform X1 n=1 Tax=Neltuma alba TaxID=207710 RepID=UPI0010A4E8D2|nr:transcription factor IIIA-like isoform X1 [Prosopis alba]XP_028770045.1 transcription factor IIIA-like isoform X1 [Prosopis alba]XP_028770046.1 transcription factor IIIA-like isoform X1 [Prosopis alba]